MVRLELHNCPTHGQVSALERYGPCPKCEHEAQKARLDAAYTRCAPFDSAQIMRAEIDLLREMVLERGIKAEADYWTRIAERLEKDRDRFVEAFTNRKKT